jgi:hypothetical protein
MLRIIFAVLVITISGCQTTGDPTQGGLFGWSEEKAKLRQNELSQQFVIKQEYLANERSKSTTNLATKITMSNDINSMQQTLKALETDNANLEKEIREHMRKKQLKKSDIKRVSLKLKANNYHRSTTAQEKPLSVQIKEVNTQNSDLHDELQFLLKN